jgi:5,10-methylenetetrahydromethanopterin reductase
VAEIGIAFQTDKPPGRYAELAAAAEAHGFDVVSVFADLLYQPPLPALLEMARATSRVRLGAACLNPYTQHPYEIAGGLAALEAVSGGRAYLGLARGTWLDAIGIEQRRPLAHLRDTAAIVRALLSGDDRGYTGQAYRLAPGIRLRGRRPDRLPPLLLGTWGPRGAALAGEIADEVKVGGSANPAVVRFMKERIRAGARAAGRPPDQVRVVLGAVTVVDEDGAAARRRARTEVAPYLAVVAGLDPATELPPGFADRIRALVGAGQDEAAGILIPDEMLDRFAFSGTPEHVAALAARVLEAGAGRVDFGTPHGLSDGTGVTLLGTAVLPLLRLAPRPRGDGGARAGPFGIMNFRRGRVELAARGQEQDEGGEEDVGAPDGLRPGRPSRSGAGELREPPLRGGGEQDEAARGGRPGQPATVAPARAGEGEQARRAPYPVVRPGHRRDEQGGEGVERQREAVLRGRERAPHAAARRHHDDGR